MLENESNTGLKKKKPESNQKTDWWMITKQIGVVALQGLVAGAAGAVGGRIVNAIGSNESGTIATMDEKIVPFRKTGTV